MIKQMTIVLIVLLSWKISEAVPKRNIAEINADYSITKFPQLPTKGIQKLQKDGGHGEGGCPLCDSSVYSYCDTKLFHDACCCNPYGNGIGSSYQCQYTDCSFINANSCQEHQLIVTCCCYSPYRSLNSYQAAF